jgi:nuclear pore complex protein Nup155
MYNMFSSIIDRGDLAYFDGLSETILAVGLVKPKAGK